MYRDVTLAPDDIEFDRWPDREDVKDAIYDDDLFAEYVDGLGVRVALEKVTQFHREVANQLIVRAVSVYRFEGWVGRTIRLCRRAKKRRNELRHMLAAEVGWAEMTVVVGLLDSVYPRAVWGSDMEEA